MQLHVLYMYMYINKHDMTLSFQIATTTKGEFTVKQYYSEMNV